MNKLSETKLPQILEMEDGRYVTINKDMHAKMLTVAEIAKSMVLMNHQHTGFAKFFNSRVHIAESE